MPCVPYQRKIMCRADLGGPTGSSRRSAGVQTTAGKSPRPHQGGIMEKRTKQQEEEPLGGVQTDLAEGEEDTVEESLRIHEEKGDEQAGPSGKQKNEHS